MNFKQSLRIFLIDPEKLKDKKYLFLVFAIFAFFVFFSFKQGRSVGIMDDFSVFWNAGNNFISGNDLYSQIGGACRYIYPPFAAMLFQLFALVPVQYAAGIFTFINLLLFLISAFLTRSILENYFSDRKLLSLYLIFAMLLSFRFFLYHFRFVQLNITVFLLSLLGVLFTLRKKETPAVICFVTATFIKVIPLFFLIWLVIRSNPKTWIKIAFVSVLCLAIPFLWRGSEQGMLDLKNYYSTFLEPFKNGRVEPEFHNQSLSAGIYKVSLPSDMDPGYDYNILHLSEQTAKQLYQFLFLGIFGTFAFTILLKRIKKIPISFSEIALIFLATHLLSGITWEYHFVSMLFVYTAFLFLHKYQENRGMKYFGYSVLGIIVFLAPVGKDTVGTKLYHYFEGYSTLTWMMLLMYFYFLLAQLSEFRKNSSELES